MVFTLIGTYVMDVMIVSFSFASDVVCKRTNSSHTSVISIQCSLLSIMMNGLIMLSAIVAINKKSPGTSFIFATIDH